MRVATPTNSAVRRPSQLMESGAVPAVRNYSAAWRLVFIACTCLADVMSHLTQRPREHGGYGVFGTGSGLHDFVEG